LEVALRWLLSVALRLLLLLHLLLELRVLLLVRRLASLLLRVEDGLRALVGVGHSKLRHPLLR
jgi:hypothetical protein